MFRCPRAAPASPFRLRFFRFAAPPNVPRSSQPSSGIRPRRPGPRPAVLAAAVAGTALAACADSVWEPPGDGPGAEDGRPMAAVVSETAEFLADVDSLPSWRKVIEGMAEPGCAFHFRRVAGSYASKEYGLAYSRKATAKAEAWRALVYNVLVTVSRPAEGGGTEVLPERLAIRAVCAMPDTEWGTEEAKGRTEAILEAHGIKFPGAGGARASADVRRALAALRRAAGRLGPRPLLAALARGCGEYEDARDCPMKELIVTVRRPVKCSVGFDYEATTGECVRNTPGGGSPGTGTPGNPGSSGGGNTNTNTPTARTVDFELSCSAPTRGQSGSCSVSAPDSAGVNLGSLNYSWSSTIGNATVATEPNGGSSWSGTATENVNVKVDITDPAGVIAAATQMRAVLIRLRTSSLVSLSSVVSYTGTWTNGTFGYYQLPSIIPALTDAAIFNGSGPWAGRYGAGDLTVPATIVIHEDLDSGHAGYPGAHALPANSNCLATSMDSVANLTTVNDGCGSGTSLQVFETKIIEHEQDHEEAITGCLGTQAARGDQANMESLTGGDPKELKENLANEWDEYYVDHVVGSTGGPVGGLKSQFVWDYWDLQTRQRGSSGTAWEFLVINIDAHPAGPCR